MMDAEGDALDAFKDASKGVCHGVEGCCSSRPSLPSPSKQRLGAAWTSRAQRACATSSASPPSAPSRPAPCSAPSAARRQRRRRHLRRLRARHVTWRVAGLAGATRATGGRLLPRSTRCGVAPTRESTAGRRKMGAPCGASPTTMRWEASATTTRTLRRPRPSARTRAHACVLGRSCRGIAHAGQAAATTAI